MLFITFLLWKSSLIFCLCYYVLCRRGNNHFDVHFRQIGPVPFLSKDGKDAVHEGRDGRRGVSCPPDGIFPFMDIMFGKHFPTCTLIWRVNNYVSCPVKV